MWASQNAHLDVVNQLLDCKEIDVHVRTNKVSGNVLILPHSRLFPNSCLLFGCGFLMRILIAGKQKQNIAWRDCTNFGFTEWTFECGQSTPRLQRN